MYCVFNATTTFTANDGNKFGWPFERNEYGYFCNDLDTSKYIIIVLKILYDFK